MLPPKVSWLAGSVPEGHVPQTHQPWVFWIPAMICTTILLSTNPSCIKHACTAVTNKCLVAKTAAYCLQHEGRENFTAAPTPAPATAAAAAARAARTAQTAQGRHMGTAMHMCAAPADTLRVARAKVLFHAIMCNSSSLQSCAGQWCLAPCITPSHAWLTCHTVQASVHTPLCRAGSTTSLLAWS